METIVRVLTLINKFLIIKFIRSIHTFFPRRYVAFTISTKYLLKSPRLLTYYPPDFITITTAQFENENPNKMKLGIIEKNRRNSKIDYLPRGQYSNVQSGCAEFPSHAAHSGLS